jgi:hypothetical protein
VNQLDPVPPDSDYFPVRITALLGGGSYLFQEVWSIPGGVIADRIGGRVNTSLDPAYAIDGSTFAATFAGTPVQVLARRSPGSGGTTWELKGFATSLPEYSTHGGVASGEATVANVNASWANLGGFSGFGPYAVMLTILAGTFPKYLFMAHGCVLGAAYPTSVLRLSFARSINFGSPAGGDMVYMTRLSHTVGNYEAFSMSGMVQFPAIGVDSYVGVCVENIAGPSPNGAVFVSQFTMQMATGFIV